MPASTNTVGRGSEQPFSVSDTSGPASLTSNSTACGRLRYVNSHLPAELLESRTWTKQVLPALLTWAGSLSNPWVIKDDALMHALRTIITTVTTAFQNLTAIRPGTAIFMLV